MAIINVAKPTIEGKDWSQYQRDIFREVEYGEGNIIVEAVAGSGKTTTILKCLELVPTDKKVIFLAFNKAIADNLGKKVPYHVEASTLHSLGYKIMKNNYKFVHSNGKKNRNILWYEILDTDHNNEARDWCIENGNDIFTLVSRLKSLGIRPEDSYSIPDMIDSLCLSLGKDDITLRCVQQVFEYSCKFTGEKGACVVDFDDMIYMPAMQELKFPTYDYIFIDECQDLNHVQKLFIQKLMGPGSRLIAVGDTHQAIYAFMGACSRSMEEMRSMFSCKTMPLSICYRCPTSIVDNARQYVPHIEASPTASHGVVSSYDYGEHWSIYDKGNVHILGRVNSILVSEALSVARRGYTVCILGNDLTPTLSKFAKDVYDTHKVINKTTCAIQAGIELGKIPPEKKGKQAYIQDMYDTLIAICDDRIYDLPQFRLRMMGLFYDNRPEVPHICFSTIHKAKGLEADTIGILFPELIPHPLSGEAEHQQEMNLMYVAVTRAMKELYMIYGGM